MRTGHAVDKRLSPLSSRLLALALATTIIVFAGSVVGMWRLHATTLERPVARDTARWQPSGEPLVVGVGRTPGGPGEWVAYASVFARLQRDLQRPVHLRYELDRAASVDALISGDVELALVSTNAYLELQERVGVVLVAAPILDGRAKDAAVLAVSATSNARQLADLTGSTLLMAPDSLSGAAFVQWLARQSSGDPETLFGSVVVDGSPDGNLTRVANGEADVASVRRSGLSSWPDGSFRVIAESPGFAMAPMVARRDVDPALVEAVRTSLLSVGASGVLPPEAALDGFSVPSDGDYAFARVLRSIARSSSTGSPGDAR